MPFDPFDPENDTGNVLQAPEASPIQGYPDPGPLDYGDPPKPDNLHYGADAPLSTEEQLRQGAYSVDMSGFTPAQKIRHRVNLLKAEKLREQTTYNNTGGLQIVGFGLADKVAQQQESERRLADLEGRLMKMAVPKQSIDYSWGENLSALLGTAMGAGPGAAQGAMATGDKRNKLAFDNAMNQFGLDRENMLRQIDWEKQRVLSGQQDIRQIEGENREDTRWWQRTADARKWEQWVRTDERNWQRDEWDRQFKATNDERWKAWQKEDERYQSRTAEEHKWTEEWARKAADIDFDAKMKMVKANIPLDFAMKASDTLFSQTTPDAVDNMVKAIESQFHSAGVDFKFDPAFVEAVKTTAAENKRRFNEEVKVRQMANGPQYKVEYPFGGGVATMTGPGRMPGNIPVDPMGGQAPGGQAGVQGSEFDPSVMAQKPIRLYATLGSDLGRSVSLTEQIDQADAEIKALGPRDKIRPSQRGHYDSLTAKKQKLLSDRNGVQAAMNARGGPQWAAWVTRITDHARARAEALSGQEGAADKLKALEQEYMGLTGKKLLYRGAGGQP